MQLWDVTFYISEFLCKVVGKGCKEVHACISRMIMKIPHAWRERERERECFTTLGSLMVAIFKEEIYSAHSLKVI